MREEGGQASASCSLEFSEKRRLHVPPATKEHKESCFYKRIRLEDRRYLSDRVESGGRCAHQCSEYSQTCSETLMDLK